MVVMSVDEMRIPVSVSMRVRSSRAPSESRPYPESGRSGSTLLTQNQADLIGDQTPQSGGPLVQGQLVELSTQFVVCPPRFARVERNASANGLRSANVVNHGLPVVGA